jgi:hypothetical protein
MAEVWRNEVTIKAEKCCDRGREVELGNNGRSFGRRKVKQSNGN